MPKRAAEESQRPKKKAKSPVAAESSDAAEARALATDAAAIRGADRTLVAAPFRFTAKVEPCSYQPGLVHRAQGPPLGSRAPPSRS